MPYANSYGGGGAYFNCGAGEGTSGVERDRSHALRGNAARDAPRPFLKLERGASLEAFPRGAWERSEVGQRF
ncbi:hypothetical protein EMIT0P294_120071 [Pseudomonas sp. IT-P294]